MKHRLGALAGVLISAAALGSTILTPVTAHAQDSITFAAATFAEAGRGDKLKAWVEKFNASQEAVKVEPISIPFSTFANTVFTQMGGGAGPDIVRFDLMDYYAAAGQKRLADLTADFKPEDYKFSSPDKYMFVDGKRYGFAFEISNFSLIYNADLLPGGTPPKTFEEFVAAAKAATKDGAYGYAYRATMAERVGFWFDLCNYVYGFGGRFSDDAGKLTLNDPKVVEGVKAYKQIYDLGVIPKGADAPTFRRMFWEGKLAMELANGGIASIASQQAPNIKLGATPAPFPTRAQGVILAPLSVNANTKHKDAAVAFLKWALEPAQQAELQSILGASNGAIPAPRSAEDLAAKPWLKVFDDQTENGVPQVVLGYEVQTPELQQIILDQVLKVLVGDIDPQKAMDDAQRMAERRVQR